MKTGQIILIVLGLAALVLGGWFLISGGLRIPAPPVWQIQVSDPILVGDPEDPFVYAGGTSVRATSGDGSIRLFEGTVPGSLRLVVELDDATFFLPEDVPSGRLSLRASLESAASTVTERTIHSETGFGEGRLPETRAILSGSALFDVRVDGASWPEPLEGLWAVAHALRREDGAIRNQGLVFSPLLRDDTVFADPERLELTVLLYDTMGAQTGSVALHVVYRDIRIERAPTTTQAP
jgi:hypothetical protein